MATGASSPVAIHAGKAIRNAGIRRPQRATRAMARTIAARSSPAVTPLATLVVSVNPSIDAPTDHPDTQAILRRA